MEQSHTIDVQYRQIQTVTETLNNEILIYIQIYCWMNMKVMTAANEVNVEAWPTWHMEMLGSLVCGGRAGPGIQLIVIG